jgi:hypothetical protein
LILFGSEKFCNWDKVVCYLDSKAWSKGDADLRLFLPRGWLW